MRSAAALLLAFTALSPRIASAQSQRAPQALRLRAEPMPMAAVVARVPAGAAVRVNGCTFAGGTWCSVTYQDTRGYIAAARLRGDAPVAAPVRRTPRAAASTGGETESASSRRYLEGPRGGCYTLSESGRKIYVDQAYCGGGGSMQGLTSAAEAQPAGTRSRTRSTAPGASARASTNSSPRRSSGSRTYLTGPRGGCYYLGGSGRKVYVDHAYCN